ncbi:MAG: LCP family protein [bacterium]|nr:LCP family protein [bacterium]
MRIPGWLFLIGVVGLFAATLVCSVASFTAARQIAGDLGRSGVQVVSFADFARAQPTITPSPLPPTPTTTATVDPNITPTATPLTPTPTVTPTLDPLAAYTWDDPRRVNVLLLGIDQREGIADERYYLTDTIIIASIDPARRTVGMLSIPRDLWVSIPGFQYGRINTANQLGDQSAYPGGGPALLARTIQENLGISIDNYVLINFNVFTVLVDLVAPNGVEVCPPEAINDPDYPDAGFGTIPVSFDAGCQRLNAERLLQYARTRATEGSDFDRARRQQEVILAVREEVVSAGGLINFLTQIPQLWTQLSANYKTDFSLEQVIALANLAQEVDTADIHTGQIDNLYVNLSTTATGDQVLIPRYNAIRTLIQQVFEPQQALTLVELRERAEAENASIVVFNNTPVTGLAGQTRDWLASQQVSVTSVGNTAEPDNAPTTIRMYTDKIWTARYIAALMGLPPERVQPGADGLTTEDVAVVVGTDIQPLLAGLPTAAPGT